MRFFYGVLLLTIFTSTSYAQQNIPASTLTNDQWDFIGVNRMLMWASNNGALSHNPQTSGGGLEWPTGSGKQLGFMEGLVIGGRVLGVMQVAGSTYNHGWEAGPVNGDGTPDNPNGPLNRIFRAHAFHPSWWNSLSADAKNRYLTDLVEWPVRQGAPWFDANNNGSYDPDPAIWQQGGVCDIPMIPGEEALWFVGNDLDVKRSRDLYGTGPIGLEMRTMIWASSGHPLLDNVIFREHTLIGRGVDSLYRVFLRFLERLPRQLYLP